MSPSGEHVRLAEAILDMRTMRDVVFGPEWFADPAWDLLLEVYVAQQRDRTTQLQAMCIAARVPRSTGDRIVNRLVAAGLLLKTTDSSRKRGVRLHLSADAERKMERLLIRAFSAAERRLAG